MAYRVQGARKRKRERVPTDREIRNDRRAMRLYRTTAVGPEGRWRNLRVKGPTFPVTTRTETR